MPRSSASGTTPREIIFIDGGLEDLTASNSGIPANAAMFVLDPAPSLE